MNSKHKSNKSNSPLKGFLVHTNDRVGCIAFEFEFTPDGEGLNMSNPIECDLAQLDYMLKGYGIIDPQGKHIIWEMGIQLLYVVTNHPAVSMDKAMYLNAAAYKILTGQVEPPSETGGDVEYRSPFGAN